MVLTEDGTLGRIDEQSGLLRPLVPGRVAKAYLDGDAVVYENWDGLIQWWGIEPSVVSSNSAQTDEGRLVAATTNRVVIAFGPGGALASWDADGPHELVLQDVTEVSEVETAGDVIAVHTEDGVVFFSPDGSESTTSYIGERVGALAPDGKSYAEQTKSRQAVELLDPATLEITPVEGPAGPSPIWAGRRTATCWSSWAPTHRAPCGAARPAAPAAHRRSRTPRDAQPERVALVLNQKSVPGRRAQSACIGVPAA